MKMYKILGNYPFQRSILNTVLIAALFLAVTLSPQAYSHGQGTGQSAALVAATADQKNQAKDLTQQLHNLIAEYKSADKASSSSLATQLTTLAEERQQLLGELIENDPAEVLRQALPDDVLDHMPFKAQAFLEQHRAMEGELQFLHVDYKDQSQSHYVYLLSTDAGEHYSLHFANHGPDIQSGSRVRVNGVAFYGIKARDAGETDGAVAVDNNNTSVQVLEAGGSTTTTTTSSTTTVLPNTFGVQKALVILVNFQDITSQPWTSAQVQSVVFGTTSNFLMENSYQQTSLSGDVVGWYTIPLSSTICDTTQIATYANNAASAAGVSLSTYTRLIYLFPNNSCLFSGLGTVGGNPSQSWINGTVDSGIIAHEFGHNLGLYHSHALECGGATLGGTCSSIEYGDTLDSLGGGKGHYDAFQKEQLGWLNNGISPPVTMATTSGIYSLAPYETRDTNSKALKIHKSTDPTTGLSTWYYVEYRQPFGFDTFISSMPNGNVSSGVVVHTATDSNPNSSNMLDMTPASSTYYDWNDIALAVGQSFSDPDSGVSITTAWTNATSAGVGVTLTQPGCVRANPSMSVSPASQSGIAGAALAYTVTVLNADASPCSTSNFAFNAVLPTGWSGVFATQSLGIAPGTSASTTLTVTSPASAVASNYAISIGAANSAATSYTSSTSASYGVIASPTVKVATDKVSYIAGQTVNISASVTIGGTALSGGNVSFTITKPNGSKVTSGSATTNSNGTASYAMKLSGKNLSGTYTVKAVATSGGVSGSGTGNFLVQ